MDIDIPKFCHEQTHDHEIGAIGCSCGNRCIYARYYYEHVLHCAPEPVIRAAKQLMANSTNFANNPPTRKDVDDVWDAHAPWERGVFVVDAWKVIDAALDRRTPIDERR